MYIYIYIYIYLYIYIYIYIYIIYEKLLETPFCFRLNIRSSGLMFSRYQAKRICVRNSDQKIMCY